MYNRKYVYIRCFKAFVAIWQEWQSFASISTTFFYITIRLHLLTFHWHNGHYMNCLISSFGTNPYNHCNKIHLLTTHGITNEWLPSTSPRSDMLARPPTGRSGFTPQHLVHESDQSNGRMCAKYLHNANREHRYGCYRGILYALWQPVATRESRIARTETSRHECVLATVSECVI